MTVKPVKYPALILAGGLGKRLRSVESERPKPMVLVEGEPFLYWLIKHLESAGFEQFIFSTGYKAQFIKDYPWSERFKGLTFSFYSEEQALGTGGAVKAVFEAFKGLAGAWVINGDTLLTTPLAPSPPSSAVQYAALEANHVFDARPNLFVEGDRVVEVKDGGMFFDAGQVFITREAVLESSAVGPCSLHALIDEKFSQRLVTFKVVGGTCFDIGTPERLERFQKYVRGLKNPHGSS